MENQSPDWSSLGIDLLNRVSKKLDHSLDYLHFRSVCSNWHSGAPAIKFPPLLFLPFDPNTETIPFFDPSDGDVHTLPLPAEARNKTFCGTSHGWLILLEEPTNSISLLNPLTAENVPLPPFTHHIPKPSSKRVILRIERCLANPRCIRPGVPWQNRPFIQEAVLSSPPSSGEPCIVMAILQNGEELGFCRPGDGAWTLVETRGIYNIDSVAYWNGSFYAVDRVGRIAACELNATPARVARVSLLPDPLVPDQFKLLESKGELLLVGIDTEDNDSPDYEMNTFIYKADLREGRLIWSKVDTMGEKTLFLSEDSNSGVVGHELHGCRRNCMYISKSSDHEEAVHFIRLRNIGDSSSSELISCRWSSNLSGPVFWLKPGFF
ncbi:putative F-box protein At5g55150 [Phoenix dactylifera]|uniref:F-box protein At5g55150 n=1 Tax=Phoenix dactylifera TaxID=42345 RepID=A0A8B8ZAS0_PHODC|nr:putative F-box protein At5g55150 [Phoenix dactylifera]